MFRLLCLNNVIKTYIYSLPIKIFDVERGLAQVTQQSDMVAQVFFLYALESKEYSYSGATLNLKKGWNIVYGIIADRSFTLAQPSGLVWEWTATRNDD